GLLYGVIALLILTGQIQPWHVYVTAFGMSYCPRHLPRPSANGDSNLLALRLPWPDNGYLSMTHVVLLVGGIFIGTLSSLVGAQWAAASMSIVGALAVMGIYVTMPRVRLIR